MPDTTPSAPEAAAASVATRTTTKPTTTTRKPRKKRHSGMGENTGRWTAEEHRLFLQGLEQHGKGWKKIASLIQSRTVVQIRTHAQKYFQKLAKARQNGEEGDITMDPARCGAAAVAAAAAAAQPRRCRKPVTGTKRKALQSLVQHATKQRSTTSVPPVLAHFYVPPTGPSTDTATASALEDSLFRFLTPCPPADAIVNAVARQAGANPIAVPAGGSNNKNTDSAASPTGVDGISIYPSWTDTTKEPPSWYAKGADVDALLDAAEPLDWLADPGDANETYQAPPPPSASHHSMLQLMPEEAASSTTDPPSHLDGGVKVSASIGSLPRVDSSTMDEEDGFMDHHHAMGSSLPALFPSELSSATLLDAASLIKESTSALHLDTTTTSTTPLLEEQAFVSTLLTTTTTTSSDDPDRLEVSFSP